jgi:hypothetical protein
MGGIGMTENEITLDSRPYLRDPVTWEILRDPKTGELLRADVQEYGAMLSDMQNALEQQEIKSA